ncbi:GMC family oxidoreductase N-terminal domain-containing protein [Acidimicrobiia bacterium]|nr:GMC family oxidoreductase N-terminal domain-containing protein [Acidimicrobiia bacterium]
MNTNNDYSVCPYKVIHKLLESLGYGHDLIKCTEARNRFSKIKILGIAITTYLRAFNLFKITFNGNFLLYKFITGNIILIFESSLDIGKANNIKDNSIIDSDHIYDTIVIGSGPGGSIAAYKLLEKEEDVLLIEKGPNFEPTSIEHHSYTQTKLQFSNEGLNFCYGNIPIIFTEGSTYGGGSEVNSGLYFKLTGKYKKKFLELSGIPQQEWDLKEQYVEKKINVQMQPSSYSQNLVSTLVNGSNKNSNLVCKEIPRWRKYNPEIHQGMVETYLNESEHLGLKRLTNSEVLRIDNSKEDYLLINALYGSEEIKLKSRKVVISAGTISTPKLLKNSKLLKDRVRLNLHPMTRCVVDYGKNVNDGDLFPPFQSWTKDLNYKFGYSVSTPPYIKATLSSLGEHNINLNPRQLVSYFSSTVFDISQGRLFFLFGKTIPFIYVKKQDREKIKKGYKLLKETLKQGGACNVWPKKDVSPISTVHIFGSLPINKNRDIDKDGALKEDTRIKICDGSLLPIAPWGNPQAVIMVLNEILMENWIRKYYGE